VKGAGGAVGTASSCFRWICDNDSARYIRLKQMWYHAERLLNGSLFQVALRLIGCCWRLRWRVSSRQWTRIDRENEVWITIKMNMLQLCQQTIIEMRRGNGNWWRGRWSMTDGIEDSQVSKLEPMRKIVDLFAPIKVIENSVIGGELTVCPCPPPSWAFISNLLTSVKLPWNSMLIKALRSSSRIITHKHIHQRTFTTTSRIMAEKLRIGYVPGKVFSSSNISWRPISNKYIKQSTSQPQSTPRSIDWAQRAMLKPPILFLNDRK